MFFMPLRDVGLALCVVLVWGMSFTVIKLGLVGMPPMLMGALRFVLSTFPAMLFVPRPRVALRWWLAYGLTVGVGQFALLFLAIRNGLPAGVASVALQSQAFFTLIFAAFLLREHWYWPQFFGLAVAAGGLSMLAGGLAGTTQGASWFGFSLVLGAAAFWGLSNVVARMAADSIPAGQKFDLMGFIVWTGLIPPLPFALLSLWLEGPGTVVSTLRHFSLASVGSVAYLAFGGTLFGSGAFTMLLTRHPPGKVAPFTLLVPVVGLATASVVLGEGLSTNQWFGCLFVLLGLVINLLGSRSVARR
ncbi:putative amino-acid metabolite efflux pump [Ralstonia condita]|uniref:Amino-acid metabolite efflux pump n=2 Tax=Ralstonia condita TaxID=3058600 RepID=A0ABM9JD84_9RALS|nr:putative amino-acid metabolite efflux pump [Ralstonia sp. LMG 7141]